MMQTAKVSSKISRRNKLQKQKRDGNLMNTDLQKHKEDQSKTTK